MTQQFSRRDALKLALQTSAIVAISQFSRTSPAYAESGSSGNLPSVSYQSFVPYSIARRGGKQTLYAYEGTRFTIHIPERSSEGDVVQFINNETQVVRSITLHTLYDRNSKIGLEIFEELDSRVDFLLESSRDRCKLIYEGLEDGQPVADLEALGLLDYIVLTSKLSGHIQQQYKIASENSKVLRILDIAISRVVRDTREVRNCEENASLLRRLSRENHQGVRTRIAITTRASTSL